MDRAIAATDADLDGTAVALAAGVLLLALGPTAAGVRARLRECR
ncbi:hypothetical protein [Kitasatospora sp. NPDC005856]